MYQIRKLSQHTKERRFCCSRFYRLRCSCCQVLYEHEIDTTKEIMAKILGVRQASKILSCNGCTRKIIEVVSPNKAVCSFCKLQQFPSTFNVDWSLRILVKPESESNKNLQIRLDHTATETLLHMLNATYDLQSATEDDIVATILEEL